MYMYYTPIHYIHTYIHTYRHTDIHTYRQTDRQTYNCNCIHHVYIYIYT